MTGQRLPVFPDILKKCVTEVMVDSLSELMEKRHLYQGFDLMDAAKAWAKGVFLHARELRNASGRAVPPGEKPVEQYKNDYRKNVEELWTFWGEATGVLLPPQENDYPGCAIPALHLRCSACRGDRTFSPIAVHACGYGFSKAKRHQAWDFEYKCPKCENPLHFFIVRDGSRVKLCGRFPFEEVAVPDIFPEIAGRYISKAIVASNTGNCLASDLYLRVAIEQFWKSIPQVMSQCTHEKPSGEELGDAYAA